MRSPALSRSRASESADGVAFTRCRRGPPALVIRSRATAFAQKHVPPTAFGVRPLYPGSEQSAGQLLDRIDWAIRDAERRTARRTMRKYVAADAPPSAVQQSI
jgi:hypothetical protein